MLGRAITNNVLPVLKIYATVLHGGFPGILCRFFKTPQARLNETRALQNILFGRCSSVLRKTWPVHMSGIVGMLVLSVREGTSTPVTLHCHLMFNSSVGQPRWKSLNLQYTSSVHCPVATAYRRVVTTTAALIFNLVESLTPLLFPTEDLSYPKATLALAVLVLMSSSTWTTLESVLPRQTKLPLLLTSHQRWVREMPGLHFGVRCS